MSVLETHEQYYQLNMNSDDIVVWYCLSSGGNSGYYYNDVPNDVVNAYYIFNRGNVTYSGVGHTSANSHYTSSTNGGITQEAISEAKLFVNTMIAAYQSGPQDPDVKIVDSVTGEDAEIRYFSADYAANSIVEENLGSNISERALYFRIEDTNLDAGKSITVTFAYDAIGDNKGEQMLTPLRINATDANCIYKANGAPAPEIQGGKVYIIYLPDEVLEALGQVDVSMVTVKVNVATTIDSVTIYGDGDTIELRKIELYDLR